jgi:hypothetical protein
MSEQDYQENYAYNYAIITTLTSVEYDRDYLPIVNNDSRQGETTKKNIGETMKEYTVWVGGGEVNDYYLPLKEAKQVAQYYKDNDYDDVVIEQVKK